MPKKNVKQEPTTNKKGWDKDQQRKDEPWTTLCLGLLFNSITCVRLCISSILVFMSVESVGRMREGDVLCLSQTLVLWESFRLTFSHAEHVMSKHTSRSKTKPASSAYVFSTIFCFQRRNVLNWEICMIHTLEKLQNWGDTLGLEHLMQSYTQYTFSITSVHFYFYSFLGLGLGFGFWFWFFFSIFCLVIKRWLSSRFQETFEKRYNHKVKGTWRIEWTVLQNRHWIRSRSHYSTVR